MQEKINKRLQELSRELESCMNERQRHIEELRYLDGRIKELSAILLELKALLDEQD